MAKGTAVTTEIRPFGRVTTFLLAAFALLAGQIVALLALTFWFGRGLAHLPNFSGDGAAIALVIAVSTPVEVLLLVLFARRASACAADYLGLIWPRRGEAVFGIAVLVVVIVAGNLLSWLLGRPIVTPFQVDIYTTASAGGWLLWLWLAVVAVTPIGEEILFRGFLFRGWLRSPRDVWPVIIVSSLLWALIHVQYDWYAIGQVFAFGLLLGWIRWASGSTILTILLHALINTEGMIETFVALKWLS
jgi:membrane protease YdiL (CAAX protease family)